MTALLNPGKAAREAAALSRAQQNVANDRQLAEQKNALTEGGTTRAAPRGRKLFVANAAEKATLA